MPVHLDLKGHNDPPTNEISELGGSWASSDLAGTATALKIIEDISHMHVTDRQMTGLGDRWLDISYCVIR
jgi:hypothetical protein